MRIAYTLKKVWDVLGALALARRMKLRESWTRRQLLSFQDRRLQSLVGFALRNSPFYRESYRGLADDGAYDLSRLPVLKKETVMENFDRLVTDPRLKLDDLYRFIGQARQDDYYLGNYVVLTTAGTSGLKGVFVYDRRAWRSILAAMIRATSFLDLPYKRTKVSLIGAGSPNHLSYRAGAGIDVGFHRVQRLDVTSPFEEIVAAVDAFQPEYIKAYPSIAALLASEQLEGRLHIHPRIVLTGAEVMTEGKARTVREAWGITPFNAYSATEGVIAVDCSHHRGMHLFEDLCIVEVVDRENQPVPDGLPGFKLLVTNLYNYTQPLIRYEISDLVTLSREPCPCKRPFRLIAELAGRNDDIIYLEGMDGHPVTVHPVHFHEPLQALKQVREYQVVYDRGGLQVSIVLRDRALREEAEPLIRKAIEASLRSLHARLPEIHLLFVDWIERDPEKMGKIKLVRSDIRRGSGMAGPAVSGG